MNTPRRIRDIAPGFNRSNPRYLTVLGSSLFFTANDGSGIELWKSDGSSAGTVRVQDINPGSGSSSYSRLTAVGSTLFFTADDGSSGSELWALDVSDQLPAISVSVIPASVSEDGAADLNFLFTRNDPVGQLLNLLPQLSVRYSVSVSASAADYSGAAPCSGQTITFAAGSSLAILSIDPNANTSFEPDETVIVTLESSADDVLSAQSSAAAVILNDDPDYSFGPITINGVNLGSTSLGYALRNSGGAPIQVTYPGGNASASNPGSGWSTVAAAAFGSGYALYWRHSGSGQTARWDLNSSGAYTSGYLLSASQLISEEASLNLDVNGDGYTSGPTTLGGVNLGSTSLGYALRNPSAAPIQVTYPGGSASASNPGGGWTAIAAAGAGGGSRKPRQRHPAAPQQ